uniref:DMT family protein n=1 Tax=Brachyspira pilosicoli TaxID=52584 RepID=UPI001E36DB82
MKGITTIILLILSNTFMTIAWYGHLKFSEMKGFAKLSLPFVRYGHLKFSKMKGFAKLSLPFVILI